MLDILLMIVSVVLIILSLMQVVRTMVCLEHLQALRG